MSKYKRWYKAIILRARYRTLDCYKEIHHVLPRSLGGDDHPSNLVDLTYREHFLVHWLLTRICEGEPRVKMLFAFHAMAMPHQGRMIASWQFDIAKHLLKDGALLRAKITKAIKQADKKAQRRKRAERYKKNQGVFDAGSKFLRKHDLLRSGERSQKMKKRLRYRRWRATKLYRPPPNSIA